MDTFAEMKEMGHERVLLCSNPEVGLQAIIAIHSTVLGPGLGGTRMWPYESFDAAAHRRAPPLARHDLQGGRRRHQPRRRQGGHPRRPEEGQVARRSSAPSAASSTRSAGTTSPPRTSAPTSPTWSSIAQETALGHRRRAGARRRRRPLAGHRARRAAGDPGGGRRRSGARPTLAGRTVAIQGLGNVGGYLAGYLKRGRGAARRLRHRRRRRSPRRASSASRSSRRRRSTTSSATSSPPARSARSSTTRRSRASRPRPSPAPPTTSSPTPTATAPSSTRRGILYAPDFVINAGGLINVFQEFIGYDQERALRRARGIYDNVLRVFEIARRDGVPTAVAADRLAEERIADVKALGPRHWDRAVLERLANSQPGLKRGRYRPSRPPRDLCVLADAGGSRPASLPPPRPGRGSPVSIWQASGAACSGDSLRELSRASRSASWRATSSGSESAPLARELGVATLGAHPGSRVEKELERRRRHDHGADVAPLHHAAVPAHELAAAGRPAAAGPPDGRRCARSARPPPGGGDVSPGSDPPSSTRAPPSSSTSRSGIVAHRLRDRRPIVRIDAPRSAR